MWVHRTFPFGSRRADDGVSSDPSAALPLWQAKAAAGVAELAVLRPAAAERDMLKGEFASLNAQIATLRELADEMKERQTAI